MCCTKRFRINAHRALKALLFPITKTPEYFSSKYKNQVFSFALLGSHTVETLLGGILQRGKKKKNTTNTTGPIGAKCIKYWRFFRDS